MLIKHVIYLHPDLYSITRIYVFDGEIETNCMILFIRFYGMEIVRRKIVFFFFFFYCVLKGQLIYYGKSERLFYAYHISTCR